MSDKMNPEIKAQWVTALRSGEYKQGRDELRTTENEFCCLGVLCDLHQKAHPEIEWYCGYYLGSFSALPPKVENWSGVRDVVKVVIDGEVDHLAHHNDGSSRNGVSRKSFLQIADAIESQL